MQKIVSNTTRTITLEKVHKGYEVRVEKDGVFYMGKIFSKRRDALPLYKQYEKISCGVCGGVEEPIKHKCAMCDKQLCEQCCADTGYFTTLGPPPYCQHCYDIGEPYMEKMQELEDASDKIYAEWKAACRQGAA